MPTNDMIELRRPEWEQSPPVELSMPYSSTASTTAEGAYKDLGSPSLGYAEWHNTMVDRFGKMPMTDAEWANVIGEKNYLAYRASLGAEAENRAQAETARALAERYRAETERTKGLTRIDPYGADVRVGLQTGLPPWGPYRDTREERERSAYYAPRSFDEQQAWRALQEGLSAERMGRVKAIGGLTGKDLYTTGIGAQDYSFGLGVPERAGAFRKAEALAEAQAKASIPAKDRGITQMDLEAEYADLLTKLNAGTLTPQERPRLNALDLWFTRTQRQSATPAGVPESGEDIIKRLDARAVELRTNLRDYNWLNSESKKDPDIYRYQESPKKKARYNELKERVDEYREELKNIGKQRADIMAKPRYRMAAPLAGMISTPTTQPAAAQELPEGQVWMIHPDDPTQMYGIPVENINKAHQMGFRLVQPPSQAPTSPPGGPDVRSLKYIRS